MVDERGTQARTHGAGVTGAIGCRYYGRDFTAGEMALLRALIAGPPPLNRHMLSKEFCRRIGWFKPDGGLKDMIARVTMLAMHRDGLIALPAPQGRQNRPGPIVFGPDTEPPLFPAPTTLDEVRPLDLRPGARMKTGREHRVPLSDRALAVLAEARSLSDGPLVFPSSRGGPLHGRTLGRLLADAGVEGSTVHRFRSSFRDWSAESGAPREVAESALAHTVGGVEGAYFRSDLFERRRALMAE